MTGDMWCTLENCDHDGSTPCQDDAPAPKDPTYAAAVARWEANRRMNP